MIVRLRMAIIVASLAAFLIGFLAFRAASPDEFSGTFQTTPPTPYAHFSPSVPSLGTALVVHGLHANKELMRTLSMAMADGGFEVYAVDMPGHGDSGAAFSFDESVRVVAQLTDLLGSDTILVGHSMGGGVLAELADSTELDTVVLYSPAPIQVDSLEVERLLVISGTLEAPRINEFIPGLIDSARSRAFWWNYEGASHSTALFDPPKLRAVVRWLGGPVDGLRTTDRFLGLALMTLAGLIIPFAIPTRTLPPDRSPRGAAPELSHVVVEYVAAMCVAVVGLRFLVPLVWLNVFATDYLLSLILIVGLLVWRGRGLSISGRGMVIAILGAAYVLGVFAIGIGSQLVHLVPEGSQWIRFPVLTLAVLPLFLRDEDTIRTFPTLWKQWTAFLVTRILLWAAVITGVLVLNQESAFLVLITHFVMIFWLGLWWMTGFIARRTGEPAAAALFAALIHGWVLAAVLVRI